MSNILPLFSTPIYLNEDASLADKALQTLIDIDYFRMDTHGWRSENAYVLEMEECKPLKDFLLSHLSKFLYQELKVSPHLEFYITNSWVTIHEEGDYAHAHSHTNSLFSGTYYLNIPKDDSSVFTIEANDDYNRLFPSVIQPNIEEYNLYNSNSWSFQPNTGSLIIFPSHIKHSTTPMTSKEKRYCLAYNVFARGELYNSYNNKQSINRLILK